MSPPLLVAVYGLLTIVASIGGGLVPLLARLSHAGMQLLMSFVAGLMLGVGVFHMLPHAVHALPLANGSLDIDRAAWWTIVGLLTTFFLQRFFHFHSHELPEAAESAADKHEHHELCDHDHDHGHDHVHHHHRPEEAAAFGWVGITLGLVLHTLMDGVALAAAVESEARVHADHVAIAGFGAFLAVFLHKPLDAMALSTMMMRAGWSNWSRHLINVLFALICPIGAGLFYMSIGSLGGGESALVGCALAFSAGSFLCISLGDLLPEIQFHSHDRIKLSLALLLGVVLAYGIIYLEESGHGQPHSHSHHEHSSDDGHKH